MRAVDDIISEGTDLPMVVTHQDNLRRINRPRTPLTTCLPAYGPEPTKQNHQPQTLTHTPSEHPRTVRLPLDPTRRPWKQQTPRNNLGTPPLHNRTPNNRRRQQTLRYTKPLHDIPNKNKEPLTHEFGKNGCFLRDLALIWPSHRLVTKNDLRSLRNRICRLFLVG